MNIVECGGTYNVIVASVTPHFLIERDMLIPSLYKKAKLQIGLSTGLLRLPRGSGGAGIAA